MQCIHVVYTSSKTDVVTGVLVCTWNIRYGSFVFFPGVCLEYVYKGISMFFVRPPHPRENNDLEFVGEGSTTSPLRYSIDVVRTSLEVRRQQQPCVFIGHGQLKNRV